MLKNLQLESYINFNTRYTTIFDAPIEEKDHNPPYPPPLIRNISHRASRYEAFLAHYQEAAFQLFFHESDEKEFPQNFDYIKGGDIVRIKHAEYEGYLAADNCYESEYPEIYVDNYTGEHKEEDNSVKYMWEVERNDPVHRGNACKITNFTS